MLARKARARLVLLKARCLMSNSLLLSLLVLVVIASSCRSASPPQDHLSPVTGKSKGPTGNDARRQQDAYETPIVVAWLEDQAISESSGLVASQRNPGVLWTHNDSGDGPFLYALDEQGQRRGVWRVSGAEAFDWEDIGVGPGPQPGKSYLYVGDIGDNEEARRQITIYRVPEPEVTPADAKSGRKSLRVTEPAEPIRLQYPDGRHDAEALLVHHVTGDIYVITKTLSTAPNVYKLQAPYSTSAVNRLRLLGVIRSVPTGLITGGDIASDGNGVILCDYFRAYELKLPGDASAFDEAWGQAATIIDLGTRQQGESVCYAADSNSLYATSEKRPTPLIKVKRVRTGPVTRLGVGITRASSSLLLLPLNIPNLMGYKGWHDRCSS